MKVNENKEKMTRRVFIGVTAASAFSFGAQKEESRLLIDKSIPAGNIAVDSVKGNTVYLQNEFRDTKGSWFYWAFRVRGAEGRTLAFRFNSGIVGTRGPAVSLNKGLHWNWLDKDFSTNDFTYTFDEKSEEVWFAFAMIYTQRDWDCFLKRYHDSPYVKCEHLTLSRKGRPVEKMRLGCIAAEPRHRVLLSCRSHACEMMASYVVEGIVEDVLSNTPTGAWLRENVEFLVIPFVDKDGVEDGDQGKNRRPHDHNRDFGGTSIYPETAAMREQVPVWGGGKLRLALDIHCPWIRGRYNEFVYQVGQDPPQVWAAQQRFGKLLERMGANTLAYRETDDLPFNQAWNNRRNYSDGRPLKDWALAEGGARVFSSFEIPFATANGTVVDAASARRFGNGMGEAVRVFLTEEYEKGESKKD